MRSVRQSGPARPPGAPPLRQRLKGSSDAADLGREGAGDMKGRKNLRRMGIVLGLGALLCAGVMASGALGMALVDPGSTDSTSTAADTTPASTDTSATSTDSSSS